MGPRQDTSRAAHEVDQDRLAARVARALPTAARALPVAFAVAVLAFLLFGLALVAAFNHRVDTVVTSVTWGAALLYVGAGILGIALLADGLQAIGRLLSRRE